MNNSHFPGCDTNPSSQGLANSLLSVMIYAVGTFYKFLPSASTLLPNLVTAALVAIVSFIVSKGCQFLYKKWFCK